MEIAYNVKDKFKNNKNKTKEELKNLFNKQFRIMIYNKVVFKVHTTSLELEESL